MNKLNVTASLFDLSAFIVSENMKSIVYGNKTIEYDFEENDQLKTHYITVEKGKGVVLRGRAIASEQMDAFIIKKASWIIEKLAVVRWVDPGDIQTGSRITYLGRSYYVALILRNDLNVIEIDFTHSRFNVFLPESLHSQENLRHAFDQFMKEKAIQKITPRVKKWSETTGLQYNSLKFMKLEKRWGSCTAKNNIIINVDAVKLSWSLIDYLIVHELAHLKIKNHSKEFWAEVSKHLSNWKQLDEKMGGMKV